MPVRYQSSPAAGSRGTPRPWTYRCPSLILGVRLAALRVLVPEIVVLVDLRFGGLPQPGRAVVHEVRALPPRLVVPFIGGPSEPHRGLLVQAGQAAGLPDFAVRLAVGSDLPPGLEGEAVFDVAVARRRVRVVASGLRQVLLHAHPVAYI